MKLTFLQRAKAMIVMRFPGMPMNINSMQQKDAKFKRADENPTNSRLGLSIKLFHKINIREGFEKCKV